MQPSQYFKVTSPCCVLARISCTHANDLRKVLVAPGICYSAAVSVQEAQHIEVPIVGSISDY
eukprot:9313-Heterococcus_DN1.PRE.1